ncbi:PhnA domain-containing protein [Thiomicrorhabdus aquaedulcis]|uniref:PhnA domain-containing protein n=1 Tax=Thiomicrorhabdus aquaedulcis TaxID=2211106 RepID=UPI000FD959B4|nr:alkylphosphonate utilization protein [Thiomicrorhabdus aquaedulcis]
MSNQILDTLLARSQNSCELCNSEHNLSAFAVTPSDESADQSIVVCNTCLSQINQTAPIDENHWRCLNDSMWSTVPAVQVVAYRMLKTLNTGWSQDLLDMLYLDDDTKAWAEAGLTQTLTDDDTQPTKDSNGTTLSEGDNVTIIKDLEVKGAGFTAKRGTMVRGIHLTDNPLHIEGKVNGTQIVLVAAYLKKA